MLQIRIIQPGVDEVVHEVSGDQAIIGRGPDSDVVISERYVSARHAKILSGLIVVDLDSTNGTFVDGARVRDAVLIHDGEFQLGGEAGDARVLVTAVAEAGDLAATFPVDSTAHRELDEVRRRNHELTARVHELEGRPGGLESEAVRTALQERIGQLELEKAELQARVVRLQRQVDADVT